MGYEVTIKNINGNEIKVDKYVKRGVSGIVLCPYEKKDIICARAVLFGTKGRLEIYDNLKNPAFALPIVTPKIGDKIILAKDYNRVMIIAPNQESYLRVKSVFKNKIFISPDIFATFLDEIPTKEDFINFAKKVDIGLYIFVLDKIYLIDAYSFYAIKKYPIKENFVYVKPFFVTYDNFKISGSIFTKIKNLFKSNNIKNFEEYYKSLIKE
jgi:hypothetical protein